MAKPSPPLSDGVKEALDRLRRLREVMDRDSLSHPLRVVMGPILKHSWILGLVIAAASIAAQQLYQTPEPVVFGVVKDIWYWLVFGVAMLTTGLVKLLIAHKHFAASNIPWGELFRQVYNASSARVALPTFFISIVVGVGLGLAGRADMLVGLSSVAMGAMYIGLTAVAPLEEFTFLGALLMVLGAVALFAFPEYPFYKLAVVWGLPFVLFDGFRLRLAKRGREEQR